MKLAFSGSKVALCRAVSLACAALIVLGQPGGAPSPAEAAAPPVVPLAQGCKIEGPARQYAVMADEFGRNAHTLHDDEGYWDGRGHLRCSPLSRQVSAEHTLRPGERGLIVW